MASRKRQAQNLENVSSVKHWKETPPGTEQKELNRMFESGVIDASQTPSQVRLSNPLFMAFSSKVFAVHFRKTKAKYGGFAGDKLVEDENDIPELGDTKKSLSKLVKSFEPLEDDSCLDFTNPPFITWVYTDHISKCVCICVAIPITSGSRDINFSLSEDGMTLVIKYVWPSALYTPLELFHDELTKLENPITLDHPKIHSLTSHLLRLEITETSRPKSTVSIPLPQQVQREEGTYKKYGVKSNDTRIIMLEFKAFQKNRIIKDADTAINF